MSESSAGSPTPRVQPFYCPYCAEEDFVPYGDQAGDFHCQSCDRRFTLRFLGLGSRNTGNSGPDRNSAGR